MFSTKHLKAKETAILELELVLNKEDLKESTKETLDAVIKEGARRPLEQAPL